MQETKKIAYREMKLRQKKDLRSKRIVNTVYRNVSTLFAYIFVKLGISPNTITISSFFISIFGFIFLSIGTYLFITIGSIFFILFRIMDDADGEVARSTNKQSLEGLYFEGMQDYIYYCCLGAGLGIGLFRLYKSEIYLYLGFFLTLVFIAGYAMTDLLKSVSRKWIVENRINLHDKDVQKRLLKVIGGRSFADRNIFLKLFGVYPAGLAFSIEFIAPVLVVLAIIEYLLGSYVDFPLLIYGQMAGILSIYLFIIFIIKLIRIVSFISRLEKYRGMTEFLNGLR